MLVDESLAKYFKPSAFGVLPDTVSTDFAKVLTASLWSFCSSVKSRPMIFCNGKSYAFERLLNA
jgi:hypothetical protein